MYHGRSVGLFLSTGGAGWAVLVAKTLTNNKEPTMPPVNPVSVTVSMDTVDLRNAESTPVKVDHVDTLQGLLKAAARNNSGFDPGAIDGIGGPKTKQATGNFQAAKAAPKDFIVGKNTWKALIEFRP